MAKRKKPEDKEKELLEKRLLKIQFYESPDQHRSCHSNNALSSCYGDLKLD